jgi:hypothetical protein
VAQSVHQRRLVHRVAAPDVDHPGVWRERGERVRVEGVPGGRRRRKDHDEHVRPRQLVEQSRLVDHRDGTLLTGVARSAGDGGAERGQVWFEGAADAAEAPDGHLGSA